MLLCSFVLNNTHTQKNDDDDTRRPPQFVARPPTQRRAAEQAQVALTGPGPVAARLRFMSEVTTWFFFFHI